MKPKKANIPIEEIRQLQAGGMTLAQIGERFGVSRNTISNYLNPGSYEESVKKLREARQAARNADPQAKPKQQRVSDAPSGKPFRIEDYIWPQQNIVVVMPPDTRDNTGKLLGDPIPGRRYIKVIE